MNKYTEKSIVLANQGDYLDKLIKIYPINDNPQRTIDDEIWERVEKAYKGTDNKELILALLKLDLFPIKDSYVPYFRRDRSAINRNPQTIDRICARVRAISLDELYERCSQPKETNRQMGPLFRRWLNSGALGINPVPLIVFESNDDDAILDGSDEELKTFAKNKLGFKRNTDDEEKGLDFVGRFNKTYVIGEAKFLTDTGGHQNAQYLDAKATLTASTNANVKKIAILDGVLYIRSNNKMHTDVLSTNLPIMSAFLLKEYLTDL